MDQVISELISTWGTFGLIIVVVGFIIYDKIIKKDNSLAKEANNDGLYTKDDMIYESLKDIKDSLETNISIVNSNINVLKEDVYAKFDNLDESVDEKLAYMESRINNIPIDEVKKIIESDKHKREEDDDAHKKAWNDLVRLGDKIHDTLVDYTKSINCQHIFVGSFHNGSKSLTGVPYLKLDIIREVYHPSDINELDHDFAPIYKDCDLTLLGKLPKMLVQNKLLYFKVEGHDSEMLKYDQIIARRMLGLGIKQIALHVTIERNKPSGFIGCVRYDNNPMDMENLKMCVKELEIIHNNTKLD